MTYSDKSVMYRPPVVGMEISGTRESEGATMRRMQVTPENAERYVTWTRARLSGLEESTRLAARRRGRRLLDGLFPLVGGDLPLSDEEEVDVAAWEWWEGSGEVTTELLHRIKRVILNVAAARVIGGLAASWSVSRRARAVPVRAAVAPAVEAAA